MKYTRLKSKKDFMITLGIVLILVISGGFFYLKNELSLLRGAYCHEYFEKADEGITKKITLDSYYGTDGKLIFNHAKGFARQEEIRYSYQEKAEGMRITQRKSYYDAKGNLVTYPDFGYARCVVKENEDKSKWSISYYDENDEPFLFEDSHASEIRYTDEDQEIIEYRGIDEKLAKNSNGIAKMMITYNDNRKEKIEYFDENNNICNNKFGVAAVLYEYNNLSLGSRLFSKETYLDDQGNLVLCEDGYAFQERSVEESENTMIKTETVTCFDTEGRPVNLIDAGYAQRVEISFRDGYSYSPRLREAKHFDKDGRPVINKRYDYAHLVYTYDKGELVKEEFFDGNGEGIVSSYGYAVLTFESRNEGDKRVETTCYYNEENQLMINAEGYAKKVIVLDEDDNLIEECHYDTDEELIRKMTYAYTKEKKTETYYDKQEKLANNEEGYSILEKKSPHNKRIELYYTADKKPVVPSSWLE